MDVCELHLVWVKPDWVKLPHTMTKINSTMHGNNAVYIIILLITNITTECTCKSIIYYIIIGTMRTMYLQYMCYDCTCRSTLCLEYSNQYNENNAVL